MKLILITLLIFAGTATAGAQTTTTATTRAQTTAAQPATCITNDNAPPASSYYWPPDTSVEVYFMRGMFTPEQREQLFAAMNTWSKTAAAAGAGVTFTYAGETEQLSHCDSCLTVTRRDVHKQDPKHYAFFNPLQQNSAGLLVSAWIDFDFATTNPQALLGFMTHELGHGMGLWDCPNCQKKKTIMRGFPGINRDNGLVAPSPCDLEVVRNVYQLQRRVQNNSVAEKRVAENRKE